MAAAMWEKIARQVPQDRPVLIAGPTASGKSDLALAIAAAGGGVVLNADALQVFADWRILTARPDAEACAAAPHALYGHVPGTQSYSVGAWLRDLSPLISGARPIIVGGTGLYFAALTEGLADIPPTPPEIREEATGRLAKGGVASLLAELDPPSAARIDRQNPMRVQRAWEVLRDTGRGIAAWQDETGPPLLPLSRTHPLVLGPSRAWLNHRIEARFDAMMANGLMEEVAANAPGWSPDLPASKAIGAAALMDHLAGRLTREEVRDRVTTQTRQYAKRQRSWFRARMKPWRWIDPEGV